MPKKHSLKFWIIFWSVSGLFLIGWFIFWQIKNSGLNSVVDNLPVGDKLKTLTRLADYALAKDNQEKTFLVLFQNNMEIRPGGGYIGSFGIVKAKNGKVIDTQIHDLSNFDGRVPDTEIPPYPMAETLNIKSWKLRDSNFSPDFKTISDIDVQKQNMAEILRAVQTEDRKSFVEIMVTSETLSDFFDNMLYMETLDAKNNEVLGNYMELHGSLEDKKTNLEQETNELKNLVIVQGLQKDENKKTKTDREYYLGLTEAQYQAQLKEKADIEKKAAEISKRLFELVGEKSEGIEFGEAVKLAQYASSATGVRAAFILAIIHQESYNNGKFGGNVGQCYVTNFETGNGTDLKGNTKIRVMHPTRDVPLFKTIATNLGFDPAKTAVSCWMPMYSKGVPYGWGGAMGPAQFIPSTWNLYDDKIQAITGRVPNPWSIQDAFLGAALLLKDNGAAKSEFNAAMRYFAGATWSKSEEFYGRSVVATANSYQKDIDVLKQAGN